MQTTNYKRWNTYNTRKLMGKKHRIMSILGLMPILIWLSMNIPRLFGKKILA